MYLITSAAYVSQEIKNEIGNLPPTFLPIKNQRLYIHQLNSLPEDEDVYLTIPQDFVLDEFDNYSLINRNINIIRVPNNLSLGLSISYALNMIGIYDEPIKILHGDTLILDLPISADCDFFVVAKPDDNYDWTLLEDENDLGLVYAGYFSFKDIKIFLKSLVRKEYNFMDAINLYKTENNTKTNIVNQWYDFGHINTFYRSKASMPSIRHFNSMKIDSKIVSKSSVNNKKIIAEAKWFQDVPLEIKYYLPQLVNIRMDENNAHYDLEYLYFISLNELFVFGKQPLFIWNKIFNACYSFLLKEEKFKPKETAKYLNNDLFLKKTNIRIEEFLSVNPEFNNINLSYDGVSLGTLKEIAFESAKFIDLPNDECISVVHGDFCFSNILIDFRRQDIKVIDPRGINSEGEFDIYGDLRYDFSKFGHSIIGLYDLIIAEQYYLKENNFDFLISFPNIIEITQIQNLFYDIFFQKNKILKNRKFLIASMIHLFISMLPLHKDSKKRQKAMIANSLRLFFELKNPVKS
jgi:hypothetical protein